jgi:hypothetical protein
LTYSAIQRFNDAFHSLPEKYQPIAAVSTYNGPSIRQHVANGMRSAQQIFAKSVYQLLTFHERRYMVASIFSMSIELQSC